MNNTTMTESDSVRGRLRAVALYGLAVQDDAVLGEPWVERVIDIEDRERKRRSLERRLANARIGAFKPRRRLRLDLAQTHRPPPRRGTPLPRLRR